MTASMIRVLKERSGWLRPAAKGMMSLQRNMTGAVADRLRGTTFLQNYLRLPKRALGWKEWIQENSGEGFEIPLDAGGDLNIPLPEGEPLDMRWLFERESKCHLQETFVAGIRGGGVWNHHGGSYFARNRDLIWDLGREHWMDICHVGRPAAMNRWVLPVARRLKGTVAVLASPDAFANYGHWLLDVVPKLGMLERAGWPPGRIDHYLVGHTGKSYQLASLAQAGVPLEKIVQMEDYQFVQADLLLFPFLNSYHFTTFQPSSMWYLRKLFYDPIDKSDGRPDKLFISRADAGFRKVTNESELREALEAKGFSFVTFAGKGLQEQAEMIRRAKVIVGPNGSGLMNLAFAQPGTFVLEFAHPRYTTMFHWKICHAAGVRYSHLASDDEPVVSGAEQRLLYADVRIHPGRVLEALESAAVL